MPLWREPFDQFLRDHHGVASLGELRTLGLGERAIDGMISRGELIRMQPGVYRGRQHPDSDHARWRAACARCPGATIAFTSGVQYWAIRNARRNGVHVLIPHRSRITLEGVIVHRSRRIDPVDVVEGSDGIRVTSPPRTLFDSAEMLGFSATRSAMEQLLNDRRCTIGTIVDTFHRLSHPRRPGTLILGEVIASRPVWQRAMQSDLEVRVLAEIVAQGLPAPMPQCPIALANGRVIHVDFGWPAQRVGLEIDDPAWHAGYDPRHRDIGRDRAATVEGWTIVRASRVDVDRGLRAAVADIGTILARRSLLRPTG